MRSRSQGRIAAVFTCIALLAASPAAGARTLIVCSALDDAELTRAVLEVEDGASAAHGGDRYADLRISHLEIVTPEFIWSTPGQPETRRFDAARSDVSPDLAQLDTVAIHTTRDAEGVLRIVDFAVLEPDALELEGLRGSLMLHETWQNARAIASLYYTHSGNRLVVAALACRRFEDD
ncbi:hypothetical protein M622_05670 [Thauera terpenica 58Eu]|jgi:hypothetical protein|uniref:Uncharacterized protein n=1 Tax=Thauera terpenica 58Eu TaxID=1348657 RepID=S9ZB17_9RHOO|nr:hypothetical protein [Thauera terpenica]EPZ14470.1 hypothetical protein M622_05670 [Thauera terpenica 58Eu]MBP6727463.1 hypothetical protein [Thauera sp.]MBP6762700.1 hypothetical protein [Thauera sp.]